MPHRETPAPRIGLIPSLDGLRAASVAIVFWAHAEMPGGVRGGTGVTVFFFLSGYLITTLMRVEYDRHERLSLRDFYLRRVLRIFPPMYLAICLGLILTALGTLTAPVSAGGVAASAFFYANYWKIAELEGIPEGLGVLWSLAVEEHYYLLFPLLYVAMRRFLPRRGHQALFLALICVAVLVWRSWLLLHDGVNPVRVYYGTDTRIDGILLGAIFAIVLNPVYGDVRLPRRGVLGALAGASTLAFMAFAFSRIVATDEAYSWGYTVQGLLLIPIFAYLITAPTSWAGRVLNWKPVAFLGVLSYVMYLVHAPFLYAVQHVLGLPHVVEVALAAVATFLFAWGVNLAVERPLATLRKKISHAGESTTMMAASR
ncbi:hypothetical protein GCM10017576_29330 [Microbacterium barkeri]|uniref:Acyltransferase 3 domain-containing protein n=1 Tax=Microbacterium barkeri TaxID=33917 RepID=A0A9W6LXT9_9MICO|nr:acyltransferase [Microbacterium barkeri]MDI6944777.1 acyltransferase [Microbacterium barkeri]MDR6875113.1 peptidoglycan/LPS O-acetylase OafA/YrhL [Microbacterium barkeri]GLJ62802.1 hypothetical protein GCM10017576_29330 [Microbacterium barkeri]